MCSAREKSSAVGLSEDVGELSEEDGELGEDDRELGEACPIHDERTIRQKIRIIAEAPSRKEAFILFQTTSKNSQT
jgi:hypothetical protein